MKYISGIIMLYILLFVKADDHREANLAFEYLNDIRVNPSSFSKEIGVDLSYVKPRPKLRWNDTLAMVAEERVKDMSVRNYFEHVDPEGYGINYKINKAGYKLPPSFTYRNSANYFESIAAGYENAVESIKGLILDEGHEIPGHRNHLLGIDDFNASLVDVGIAFLRSENSEYESYICVIIAKHSR